MNYLVKIVVVPVVQLMVEEEVLLMMKSKMFGDYDTHHRLVFLVDMNDIDSL
jgi:hypothetical protein